MDWVYLARSRIQWRSVVNMLIKRRVSQKAVNSVTKQTTVRFWRTLLLCGVRSLHENHVVGPNSILQNSNPYVIFRSRNFLLFNQSCIRGP